MTDTEPPTHDEIAQHMQDELDWPMYYVSGEHVDAENFVPAYYRVEGPNGPLMMQQPGFEPGDLYRNGS